MDAIDIERLKELSIKMGVRFVEVDEENVSFAKILDISKPNRPEVKEFFQRELERMGNKE